jgi:hypothetical protein
LGSQGAAMQAGGLLGGGAFDDERLKSLLAGT